MYIYILLTLGTAEQQLHKILDKLSKNSIEFIYHKKLYKSPSIAPTR